MRSDAVGVPSGLSRDSHAGRAEPSVASFGLRELFYGLKADAFYLLYY
jgi:hypothetical protein